MHLAIAGSGDLASYLVEEFTAKGHHVVVLSRSLKPRFEGRPNVTQAVIDYSVESIVNAISGCEAMISTILDYSEGFIDIHLALIEACKQSRLCKRFIPSEFGGNIETHPHQPEFYFQTREPVRKILREQTELEWTLVSVGWLIDYVVPSKNRYLKDIGPAFPIDVANQTMEIPGTGNDLFNVTCARDVAKSLVALLEGGKWVEHTYITGEKTCWADISRVFAKKYPALSVSHKDAAKIKQESLSGGDEAMFAEYQLYSITGAACFDDAKIQDQRERYFKGIHFRKIQDLLDAVDKDDQVIV
ncbi:hypothetical protein N7491_004565 [Penicillium cf. griseofulvum]|uniref:NAD(P)-binding domain-containing protein n=1 Tax=Penicillium cf. griseofulvum TaxID=2972120 RepID=A0A9W9J2W0_9EURO|nr:hypothetical protein N7472_007255 [Penicillium cf. griseofulvum]KAJ5422813.1 hypothetical protein N7445_010921 [Penicillium cf. griseofulvum]KAJ5433970.1 hypothetical protein N7491_004565 [Penicillium cf. griseofulvum]